MAIETSTRSRGPAGGAGARERAIAAAWGFAEATLFFVVPDVWLTRLALGGAARALIAAAWAGAGAVAAGALMWWWGAESAASAERALDALPAIAPAMIERVRAELAGHGPVAVAAGGFAGTPYKVYAVEAGALGVSLPAFLAASAGARLARFGAAVLLAAGLARWPLSGWSAPRRRLAHAVAWAVFYGLYWSLVAW